MHSFPNAVRCAVLLGAATCHSPDNETAPGSTLRSLHPRGYELSCLRRATGRGSGTRDEHLAALYAASLFAGFGLEPGGDEGSFLQKAPLPSTLPPPIAALHGGFCPSAQNRDLERRGHSARVRSGCKKDAILLTAHLDHLGIGPAERGRPHL